MRLLGITDPTAATDIVADDFNSDGYDDLVMWTRGSDPVPVRLQDRAIDPPFRAEVPLDGPLTGVQTVINTYLDGALRPDLLVYDSTGSRPYISNGPGGTTGGTFTRQPTLVGTGTDELVLVEQLDNQGRDDALFVNAGTLKLSLQSANGFGPLTT